MGIEIEGVEVDAKIAAKIAAGMDRYKAERRLLRPEESMMLREELSVHPRISLVGENELDQRNAVRGLHKVLNSQGVPVLHIDGRDHTTPADVILGQLGKALENQETVLWSHFQDLVIPLRTPKKGFSAERSELLLRGIDEVPDDHPIVVSSLPDKMLRDYKADEELVELMQKTLGEVHIHNVWPASAEQQFYAGRLVPPGAIIHAVEYPNMQLHQGTKIPSVGYANPARQRGW